jgi:hypothetical protein
MQSSESPADLGLELRILRDLEALAKFDPDMSVTTSLIGQRVDESAERVRPILSGLANRGFLRAHLVMACAECGAETEGRAEETVPTKQFCRTCGDERRHEPVVIFHLGEPLLIEARRSGPKRTGRNPWNHPLLRPIIRLRNILPHRSHKMA